ncbi:MAG: ATP-dependent DNA helicase RecG [Monoglobales bacterium]
MYIFDQPITTLKGVGESRQKLLSKLKIKTIGDLLYFFPRYIEDRSVTMPIFSLTDGARATVRATVVSKPSRLKIRNNLTLYTMPVKDSSGTMHLTWYNNKYIENAFTVGREYNFYGKVEIKYGKKQMENPTYEAVDNNLHTGRIVPVYPLTENLPQKTMRLIARECIDKAVSSINDPIPLYVRKKYGLCEINYALSSIHFPETKEDYSIARHRFVFEELLMLQMGMLHIKTAKTAVNLRPVNTSFKDEFIKKISFSLTGAQNRVLDEICSDISSEKVMNRLVQGDVGSGKTVLAFAAMYIAQKNGRQSVLMAPTEVLANQHYKTALEYFDESDIQLLTGSLTAAEKKAAYENIKSGKAKIIIGTHALIENKVEYSDLSLVITDEQHRFGVRQRAMLAEKGDSPHILIMSATPIPRTLSLIIYGELDVSVVDELPPGRQKVDTFAVDESMRQRINAFMRKNLAQGRQIYVICPLIEESEKMDLKAAKSLADHLQNDVLPDYSVRLLHGKMKASEKNQIMNDFASGKINVLVSTTVIEVGMNVPNATVMIIENAERFGLSQLHQIRGRVGRGAEKSYCIMFSEGEGNNTKKRLDVMTKTNDGFEIAKRDLELRGPGDFLGTRQHGMPELNVADIFTDFETMKLARNAAEEILAKDPDLSSEEHIFLKLRINRMFEGVLGGNIIG